MAGGRGAPRHGAHAYRNVRTPIVEHTQLFTRGWARSPTSSKRRCTPSRTGPTSTAGRPPEPAPRSTAGLVRAVVEHNLLYDGGKRLYYMGPMFRHERPQRGRYRQFHQIGAEALGFGGPTSTPS
jgi:histidyl-tRNA synthetase